MYNIAGYYVGHSQPSTFYSNVFWGEWNAFLYKVFPTVSWYAINYLVLIYISETLICNLILLITKDLPKAVGIMTYLGLYMLLLCYYSVILQFTMVASVCCLATICCYFSLKYYDKSRQKIIYIVIGIMYFIGYGIRFESALLAASSLLVIALYDVIWGDRHNACKMLLAIAIAFVTANVGDYIYDVNSGLYQHKEFNDQRSFWRDFDHLEYEGNEDVYNSVGWDESLYNMGREWYFMDENVTLEAFKELNEKYDQEPKYTRDNIIRSIHMIKSQRLVSTPVLLMTGAVLFSFLCVLIKKELKGPVLLSGALIIVYFVESLYIALDGRLPMRVLMSLVYLLIVPAFMIVIDYWQAKKKSVCVIGSAIMIVTALILNNQKIADVGLYINAKGMVGYPEYIEETSNKLLLEEYVTEHQDNVYIFDTTVGWGYNPFVTYSGDKPTNLILWGGSLYDSPMYYEQLAINGYESFYSNNFFDENVYFCSVNCSESFVNYMLKRYPTATIIADDVVGKTIIYKWRNN